MWIVGIFTIMILAAPLLAEVVRSVMKDADRFAWSRLAGISPAGVLVLVWGEGGADPVPGILVQIVIAVALAMLFHFTDRRGTASAATVAPLPA